MTRLLQKAFAEAEKLEPARQDALAERILADLRDEAQWDKSYGRTSDEQWDRMARVVREDVESGKTKDLDDTMR